MEKRTKRKNILSSFLTLLITAALLIGSITTAVFAGDYEAGKTGNISLKIQETGDDGIVVPIPNVKLILYKVGSVTFDGNVHFVLDSAFADTGINFDELQNAEGWYSAAATLSETVKESGISGIEMQSDEEGKIVYNDQAEGVYLIVQSDSDERVSVSPMLLTVPFAEEETGWTYDVQAYPKAVTNDRKETQMQVTKQLFYINEDFEIIEMEADDATYKIGVFLDKEGTIPFRSDYMKDIRIVNDHSGTAIWTDVPDGTYYVFELDENGNPIAENNTIEVESGKTFYYNVTNENGDETLTVWCWDPTFNIYAMEQAEKIYQKDHPDFKLDIQENIYNDIETKLITAATSGDYSTLPDIFLMQDYSFHKNIANFPGIFTELTDSGIDFSQFTEGKLADSTAEGKNYGLPFDNGATIMAIRSDMVEAAGLTVDDFKDTTWSQFEELAKKVVEANGVPMIASSGGSELLMEMLQSAGASPIVDGKVHIADNEALKKTMEVYKKLVDEGIIAEYTDWDQYIASMNDGKTAGVINGCWIMSSIQAAEDQSGKWAIVNMPKLDGVDGATNYANCGGASWAVSSNCKNTELAFDFLKSTFGSSVELYDDLLPNAGAIASYIPAAQSDVYNQASDFYGGQAVYKDIVGYAGSVPAFDCGAYYSDIRSALTDAITNVVQNNADIDGEMNNAQETLEFNIEN